MPQLSTITVIHKTANKKNADTDADFQLQIGRAGPDVLKPFPDLPHDEREKGRTDQYVFDVSGDGVDSSDLPFSVIMRIVGSAEGWLPESIWVLGETTAGETVVLGAHPQWNDGWFDTNDSDPANGPEHVISN